MKSQGAIVRAITENRDLPYFEAITEIDNDPNILETFFIMLAERRLEKFFASNRERFLELSKKLDFDETDLMRKFNDPSVNNDHLYFSLMKAFSEEVEGQLLRPLKSKLK